jgi:hypothetical protein
VNSFQRPGPQNIINYCGFMVVVVMVMVVVVVGNL